MAGTYDIRRPDLNLFYSTKLVILIHKSHDGRSGANVVSAEMNECLKLGSGKGRANVRGWVTW